MLHFIFYLSFGVVFTGTFLACLWEQRAPETLSWSGWIYSKVHHFTFFFVKFFYIYLFFSCLLGKFFLSFSNLLCVRLWLFVCIQSVTVVFTVWRISISDVFHAWTVCVGGGGGGGRGMGVTGVTYCMSLWAFLSSLCASVCFCMTEFYGSAFTDTECDVCRSPVCDNQNRQVKKTKTKERALLLIWHAVYNISSPNCCYSILHTKCDLFPVASWIVASIDPNANTAL